MTKDVVIDERALGAVQRESEDLRREVRGRRCEERENTSLKSIRAVHRRRFESRFLVEKLRKIKFRK